MTLVLVGLCWKDDDGFRAARQAVSGSPTYPLGQEQMAP